MNVEANQAKINLILNSGFEIDTDGNYRPDEWSASKSRGAQVLFGYGKGRSGHRSAKLSCYKIDSETKTTSHAMLSQTGTHLLGKGRYYKLSFYAKHAGFKIGALYVGLRELRNHKSCGLDTMVILSKKQNEWKKYTIHFRASSNCKKKNRFQIWFREKGTLWIDDVELEEVEKTKFIPTNVIDKKGRKNKVLNSSFECGTDGWGSLSLSRLPWGGLGKLFGEIDTSHAIKGKASMKVEFSEQNFPVYHFDYFKVTQRKIEDPLLGNIGWLKVSKGEEYTLSVYLKSKKPEIMVRLGIYDFMKGPISQIVKVSNRWKRYLISIKPRSDYCFVLVGPELSNSPQNNHTLWVDAIQFEKGNKATEYQPSDEMEMGGFTRKAGNIFTLGEKVEIFTIFYNSSYISQNISYEIKIFDFFDRLIEKKSLNHVVAKESTLKKKINLNLNKTGFFNLEVHMRWVKKEAKKRMRMAIIPKYQFNDSIFGINHAYGWDYLLKLCKNAGITWVRDWSLKWNEVEPKKGRFDFSNTDVEIDRLLAKGMNVLGLLPFPSNEWSSSATNKNRNTENLSSIKRIISFAPKKRAHFNQYIKQTVRHNKKRIRHWQILNEPITTRYSLPQNHGYFASDYFFLIKEAFIAAKKSDPDCKILIGLNGFDKKRIAVFEYLFKMGAMKYSDIITVHSYPRLIPPENLEVPIKNLTLLMKKYKCPQPIWITEHGYYSDDDPEIYPTTFGKTSTPLISESLQAAYAIRFATIQISNGVKKIFFHSGKSTRLNHDNIEGIFFEYGGAPRKIYAAIAAFSNMITPDMKFVRKLELGSKIWAYLFKKENKYVLVIWEPKSNVNSIFMLINKHLVANDIMLNPIPKRKIELTPYPTYVTASGLDEQEFLNGLKFF